MSVRLHELELNDNHRILLWLLAALAALNASAGVLLQGRWNLERIRCLCVEQITQTAVFVLMVAIVVSYRRALHGRAGVTFVCIFASRVLKPVDFSDAIADEAAGVDDMLLVRSEREAIDAADHPTQGIATRTSGAVRNVRLQLSSGPGTEHEPAFEKVCAYCSAKIPSLVGTFGWWVLFGRS